MPDDWRRASSGSWRALADCNYFAVEYFVRVEVVPRTGWTPKRNCSEWVDSGGTPYSERCSALGPSRSDKLDSECK